MRRSLKSIVRAISPFTKKRGDDAEEGTTPDYSQYNWDLSGVDLKQAMRTFYKKYNPEKAYIVNEILFKYENEEKLLLQQLCERYNLTEEDIQVYLDQAPLLGGSNSRLSGSTSKRRQSTTSNASNSMSDDKGPEETKSKQKNASGYKWDLTGVDIGITLTTLYKDHNPTKVPNLNALQNKSDEEISIALRQLCKRHNLAESDMQVYIDKGKKRKDMRERDDILNELDSHEDSADYARSDGRSAVPFSSDNHSFIPPADLFPKPGQAPPRSTPTNRKASVNFPNYMPPPPPPPYQSNGGFKQPKEPLDADQSPMDDNHTITTMGSMQPTEGEEDEVRKRVKPTYYLPGGKRFTMGPVLDELKTNPHISARIQLSAEAVNAEIERLEQELAETKLKLEEINEQHQKSLLSLKENQNAAKRRESQFRQLESAQLAKSKQRIEELIEDSKKLKTDLKEQIEQYDSLLDLYQSKSTELEASQKKLPALQLANRKLVDDKRDLLQLINILASAPMAAKNVLESYFSKLASSAPRDTFLAEKVLKAKDLPMGDRVDNLLQWKRKQEPLKQEPSIIDEDSKKPDEAVSQNLRSPLNAAQKSVVNTLMAAEELDGDGEESYDERDLPTDDEDDDEDRKLTLKYAEHSDDESDEDPGDKELEASLKKLSPSERKIYESLRLHKEESNKKDQTKATPYPSNNRNTRSPSPFLARSVDLPSVTSSEIDERDIHPPTNQEDVLQEQYELVKQFYQHQKSQQKITEKLAKANLSLQEQQTEKAMNDVLKRTGSSSPPRSSSRSRQPVNNVEKKPAGTVNGIEEMTMNGDMGIGASDWVECYDPRSQRRYYYSAMLKKSTWVKPPELDKDSAKQQETAKEPNRPLEESKGNASPMRYASPQNTRVINIQDIKETTRSVRDQSPSAPLRSWSNASNQDDKSVGQNSVASSRALSATSSRSPSANSFTSKRSQKAKDAVSPWVTAIDQKSNRKYWYNRETKVSTWRKPVDLI